MTSMFRTKTSGFDRVRRMLGALARAAGRPLLGRVGAVIREQTDRRFDTKRDPSGARWREWSPAYADTRPPGASLLIDKGLLRRAIEDRVAGGRVEIVARTPYAGHVQARRAFLGIGSRDADDLRRAIEDHFREAIGAA